MSTFNDYRDRFGEAYRAMTTASTQLVTKPAIEPVTLREAKEHVRRGSESTDDNTLKRLIRAARRQVEKDTGRALITQTHDLVMSAPPDCGVLLFPKPQLQSVTSVTTYDQDDAATVLDASSYIVETPDDKFGQLTIKSTVQWPTTTLRDAKGVIVRFVCGYGDEAADVPEDLIHAMLLLVGGFFEHREHVIVAQFAGQFLELPRGYRALIDKYCVR